MPSILDIVGLINLAMMTAGDKSQRQLALDMHLNHSALTPWINGKALPSDENMIALATIARADPAEWLLRLNAKRSEGQVQELYIAMLDQYLHGRDRHAVGVVAAE